MRLQLGHSGDGHGRNAALLKADVVARRHGRKLDAPARNRHACATQCLKRRVIRSGARAEDQRVAKPVDVEIHHRAHRPIAVGLHELGRAEQPQFFHIEKHDPHLRPRPRLGKGVGETHEDHRGRRIVDGAFAQRAVSKACRVVVRTDDDLRCPARDRHDDIAALRARLALMRLDRERLYLERDAALREHGRERVEARLVRVALHPRDVGNRVRKQRRRGRRRCGRQRPNGARRHAIKSRHGRKRVTSARLHKQESLTRVSVLSQTARCRSLAAHARGAAARHSRRRPRRDADLVSLLPARAG